MVSTPDLWVGASGRTLVREHAFRLLVLPSCIQRDSAFAINCADRSVMRHFHLVVWSYRPLFFDGNGRSSLACHEQDWKCFMTIGAMICEQRVLRGAFDGAAAARPCRCRM